MKGRSGKGGGSTSPMGGKGSVAYDMGNKDVVKEAKQKTIGKIDGGVSKKRLDRPGRANGGRVSGGAPFSAAHSAGKASPSFPKENGSGNQNAPGRSRGGKC